MSPWDARPAEQLEFRRPVRPVEDFRLDQGGHNLHRTVTWNGRASTSSLPLSDDAPDLLLPSLWDWLWLRQRSRPHGGEGDAVRVADLFSGCGQMGVGISEAARALGLRCELGIAVDLNRDALEVYRRIFPQAEGRILQVPIEERLPNAPRTKPRKVERQLVSEVGDIDLLVGGPPCQGHSDFNNHTRREDDRNALALKMVRFAELVAPKHIVLENVRGIIHDRGRVFQNVREHLERLGYRTAERLLKAEAHGVPQRRWRMFLVASRVSGVDVEAAVSVPEEPTRTFRWACEDLMGLDGATPLDTPSTPNSRNQKRIDYLFRRDCWELPDSQRPECHRNGGHSYKSIYGRLWWDRPAQTITTGFRCMGQGRFVHPAVRRTITAHEAARLQFIPDFVDFSGLKPTSVARLIGNAVPPKLLYGIALALLAPVGQPASAECPASSQL